MSALFSKKRFWLAVGAVVAVVVNHFLGYDETQVVDVIGAIVAAFFGTSAGLSAGQDGA